MEFKVTIERHGYNAAKHTYSVIERYGDDRSISAAIEALTSHRRQGLTYPPDSELTITVTPVSGGR